MKKATKVNAASPEPEVKKGTRVNAVSPEHKVPKVKKEIKANVV